MSQENSGLNSEKVVVQMLSTMGFSETKDMAVLRTAISKSLSEREKEEELPSEVIKWLNIYRDMAEVQLDAMDTPARSRAMVGYMLLKAEAYRQGGWVTYWLSVIDEAEEQAHHAQVRNEFNQSLDMLWRIAMLLILQQINSSIAGEGLHEAEGDTPVRIDFSGEIEALNDEDLMGAVQIALYEAEVEDPDEYLIKRGLL